MTQQPRDPQGRWVSHDETRAKTGLFRAGQVAVWVWVVIGVVFLLIPVACCAFCGFGSVVGAVIDTPPSPTP